MFWKWRAVRSDSAKLMLWSMILLGMAIMRYAVKS